MRPITRFHSYAPKLPRRDVLFITSPNNHIDDDDCEYMARLLTRVTGMHIVILEEGFKVVGATHG